MRCETGFIQSVVAQIWHSNDLLVACCYLQSSRGRLVKNRAIDLHRFKTRVRRPVAAPPRPHRIGRRVLIEPQHRLDGHPAMIRHLLTDNEDCVCRDVYSNRGYGGHG